MQWWTALKICPVFLSSSGSSNNQIKFFFWFAVPMIHYHCCSCIMTGVAILTTEAKHRKENIRNTNHVLILAWLCHNMYTSTSKNTKALLKPLSIRGSGDSSVVRAPNLWSKGCGFESLLENFLLQGHTFCADLFRYPFHPRVTAVARKRSRSFCQRRRLQLNTHTPYVCGFAWSDTVHGCMGYTERAEIDSLWQQILVAPAMPAL